MLKMHFLRFVLPNLSEIKKFYCLANDTKKVIFIT